MDNAPDEVPNPATPEPTRHELERTLLVAAYDLLNQNSIIEQIDTQLSETMTALNHHRAKRNEAQVAFDAALAVYNASK